ncbi:MAG: response regulator transcription factor [Bacteriovoracaceae bacterium]|jgi:DNA-binding response OmpR family regulator|nr:response regulator transcription factor [Bacteriovoracaceae bacterium]
MGTNRILLVEDEEDIRSLIKSQLLVKGFEVSDVDNGEDALELIQSTKQPFDLYIVDWMLPGVTGIEICKFIRMYRTTKSTPILMVTALTRPENIVEGLDAGADDYLTKPFDINVLYARVKALLRRSERVGSKSENPNAKNIKKIGSFSIDTDTCKIKGPDGEVSFTLSEYKLLVALIDSEGKVLTRKQLIEIIQDGPVHVTARIVDTHIFGLRKKLGEDAKLIETIRGIGYRVCTDY